MRAFADDLQQHAFNTGFGGLPGARQQVRGGDQAVSITFSDEQVLHMRKRRLVGRGPRINSA